MLPPLAPNLLETNPHFADLYKHLTRELLSIDGSSKSNQQEYDATRRELRQARETALAKDILVQALNEVSPFSNKLQQPPHPPARHNETTSTPSNDLRDLVYMISNYLHEALVSFPSQLPSDADRLMIEEVETFKNNLSRISEILSSHIIELEKNLAHIVSLSDSDGTQQPSTSKHATKIPSSQSSTLRNREFTTSSVSLASILSAQRGHQTTLSQQKLPSLLTSVTSALLALLSTHEAGIISHIRHLERTTHGIQSRHLQSRAAFLRTVAEGIALKTTIQHLSGQKDIYGDETMLQALENAHQHLQAEDIELINRERGLQDLLLEYEACEGGEERMKVLGTRYRELEQEGESVKKDIERLEGELAEGIRKHRVRK